MEQKNQELALSKGRHWLYKKCVIKAEKILPDRAKISRILRKARKIFERLRNLPRCRKLSTHVCDFCDLLSDYFDGTYPNLPLATIAALLGGLLYLVLPMDMLADFFPVLGWLDDAAVLGFVLKTEQNDIDEYKKWKDNLRLDEKNVVEAVE